MAQENKPNTPGQAPAPAAGRRQRHPPVRDRDQFASWNGTAPLGASSGQEQRQRLSRAGSRGPMRRWVPSGAATGPVSRPLAGQAA